MPKQGSKSGKSSKTARVLNLLTDPDSIEEPAEEAEAPAKPSAAKLPDDRKTQAKIRGALEQELAAEAPTPPAKPRPASPKSASALRAAAPVAEDPEAPAEHPAAPARRPIPPKPATIRPVSFPAIEADVEPEITAPAKPVAPRAPTPPKPAVAAPAPAPAPDPAPAFTVPTPQAPLQAAVAELHTAMEKAPDEYICYNVTQALVEDKADKYIRMFGLCSCNRCRIDVIALALSNLPAKYVVAKPDELIPRLSMYEQKYNAAVVTQVMSACKKVLDRPHHVREQN